MQVCIPVLGSTSNNREYSMQDEGIDTLLKKGALSHEQSSVTFRYLYDAVYSGNDSDA